MTASQPHIDPVFFQLQFEKFREFVRDKSGLAFISFASNPYTEREEGYKYSIYTIGREALGFQEWKSSDIGSGKIAEAVIAAIQIPNNNLVPWESRYGEKARPHHPLFEARENCDKLRNIEACLFKLYREEQNEQSFSELTRLFGKQYPLLAYLFFLKDRSKYLPIKPTFVDRAFEHLGADFKTRNRCSFENYLFYLELLSEVKLMLAESLMAEASLLDAHSFTWILVSQMKKAGMLADIHDCLNLSDSEREAISKRRVGQDRFRQSLIDYWSGCAVTGVSVPALLTASHIKPWANGDLNDRWSCYNGLLLSPALEKCFDSGYISFSDDGRILISSRLTIGDTYVLGIHSEMKLRRIEPAHKVYLDYHRKHRFE